MTNPADTLHDELLTTTTIADDVVNHLKRFIAFAEPAQADVLALWVLHTWTFDAAYCTPYLYVHSAEKQSGKTRVIEVAQGLARHAQYAASMTSAAMFRAIGDDHPTLFFDEVDAVFTGKANEELRGVLNSGYKRGGNVLRFNGVETESLSTFAPKLLAGIDNGRLPDTLADRCIPVRLKRKAPGEDVERYLWRRVEKDAAILVDRIQAWAGDAIHELRTAEPDVIETLTDRQFEIAEPLLAIGEHLGGEWTERAKDSVIALLKSDEPKLSLGGQALMHAREYMEATGADRISSKRLIQLMDMEGHSGAKRLGAMLRPFGVRSSTMAVDGTTAKGYYKRNFTDAWERYL